MSNKFGKVIQVIGPVIDVRFSTEEDLPAIYTAIHVTGGEGDQAIDLVAEVMQHLGDDVVRCVAMSSTDGLVRGMAAENTGSPIKVPVGPGVLGRIFNVLGQTVDKVDEEVKGFVEVLSRKEIIQKSLDNFGYILIAEDMDEAIEAANEIAPEHMEIVTANPFEDMMKVKNAGAIFIGEYSSEPLGDYFAGPNHVLPTNGTAKFFSALSVDDFIKKSSIVYYSKSALRNIHKDIIQFATSEQLTAHANSIAVRFEDEDKE